MICTKAIVKQTRDGAPLLIRTLDVVNDGVDERAHDKSNVKGGLTYLPPQTVDCTSRKIDSLSSHFMSLLEILLPQFEGDIHQ